MIEDLRLLLREFTGSKAKPTAMLLDSHTTQSTTELGARAGYDGAKRRKGSKVHAAVDTLDHLLALHVTQPMGRTAPRSAALPARFRTSLANTLSWPMWIKGTRGRWPKRRPAKHGIRIEVVKHRAKRGFVLLPRRWAVERSFAYHAC
jgi:hypothetical protein